MTVSPLRWPRRRGTRVAALFFGALGIACLVPSALAALAPGDDADIIRLWRVGQFIHAGINPYPLARAALENAYGPSAGGTLSRADVQVYAIPRSLAHREAAIQAQPAAGALVDAIGVPEATYPPPANLLLALTIGLAPVEHLNALWTALGLLLIAMIALLFSAGPTRLLPELSPGLALALLLFWAPTHDAIQSTQFSLLVLACLLAAHRWRDTHEVAAGLLYTVALIKPSMAIPFLFLPLVRGRWRTLAVVVALQFAGLMGLALWCGSPPWQLPGQWLSVAGYFTQGTLSLQELINRLHLDNTPAGLALTLGFLVAVLAWCWHGRAASDDVLFDFLCFASVLWTYHRPYDFVVLFLPLARQLAGRGGDRAAAHAPALAALSFVILSLALGSGFLGVWHHPAFRALRWIARALLIAWFLGLGWRLRHRKYTSLFRVVATSAPQPLPVS